MFYPLSHSIIPRKIKTSSFLHYFSGCKNMMLPTSSMVLKSYHLKSEPFNIWQNDTFRYRLRYRVVRASETLIFPNLRSPHERAPAGL